MKTCTKRYQEIPFAHRAPYHDGHCRLVHGHNWSVEFEFIARELDENGFVMDFGKLKPFAQFLKSDFDHALVIAEKDPERNRFMDLNDRGLAMVTIVPDTSSEGLAKYFYDVMNEMVVEGTNKRVVVKRCTVIEDSRNSATYQPV